MAELTKLGRYQLRRVLGRGAMGVVYEGLDPSLNRRVAVKTILRNAAIDEETAQHYSAQFAREARAAGRLNHPNIVQVHDFAEEGDVAYLVMEFIEGRELRSFFEARETFAPAEVVRIMGELLDALDFAHEAGVIHRDVKPANVMLDARKRVKLADFGVARIQDSERSAAGTMVGTPAFMSPEQISGAKIDRRTDIFSAGVVLYQLLTGEQPFTGEGAWTVAKKIMQDDPPHPSSVAKSVSPVFDGIVRKALAKSPEQRYASAHEFAVALRSALAPAQPAAAATIPPAAPAAASRPGIKASEAEVEFWKAIQNSTDAAEFEFYLEQFPEGTYAALARHKIAKLKGAAKAEDTVRLEAEAAAKRAAAEEKARREAEEKAKQEAYEKAEREAAEKARREAEEKARREAEEKARREAAAKAKREAEERLRRETEEKVRQAQALARLKAQEEAAAKARAKARADEDSTVALPPRSPAPAAPTREREPAAAAATAPPEKSKSMPVAAAIAAVVVIGGVAAYFFTGRTPAPAPVAETAPPKPAAAPAASAVDADKIRRETEERLRKEFSEKAAAERAALEKSLAEKVAAEAAAAKKVAEAKSAAEKAAAEKAVAAAAAARAAAEKAAAQRASEEKAAVERAAVDRAAAERAAAEKAAAEKVAADKAAAEKAAAEKAAAEKVAAEKQVAVAASSEALLDRFIQRVGRNKVVNQEPPAAYPGGVPGLALGEVIYVNDGSCGPGRIKEVTGANVSAFRASQRPTRCISLSDERVTSIPTKAPVAASAAPAAPAGADAQLERFIQRVGRDKVVPQEPPAFIGMMPALERGQVVYVNDGSCGRGKIKEVTGIDAAAQGDRFRPIQRPSRCISLDGGVAAAKPPTTAPAPAASPATPAPAAASAPAGAPAATEKAPAEKAAEQARIAARFPYEGFWRGEQGIWRVQISVNQSEVNGSIACYRRGSWSRNAPITGQIAADGTVQAKMAMRMQGWLPREVLGRLPRVEVALSDFAQRVDCPNGSVTLKRD